MNAMDVRYHRKMNVLRWSLLNTLFIIILSVNNVIPATHEEGHNATTVPGTERYNSSILDLVPLHDKTKPGNKTQDSALDSILNKPKDKTLSSHQPPDKEEGNPAVVLEKEKCITTQKKTKKVTNGNGTARKNNEKGKHTGEEIDMTTTCVTPRDDDEIIIVKDNATRHINCSEEGSDINVCPPKVFPHGKNVQSIENANVSMKARLYRLRYDSYDNTTDVSSTPETLHTDPQDHVNQTELLPNSTVSSEKLQNIRTAESDSNDKRKLEIKNSKIVDKSNENGMPTSVIALVTTITVAIVLVVGYLGMIGWKRYIEHKYGHRELLVNDLEFDTNDLRHFEL